jgi:GTP-binding protein
MINLQNAEFLRSAAGREGFPKDGLPQIVFAGRSNVGKSSVINCLLSRKNLARTSSMPGKTANVNLYFIDRKLYFTDLPGYGYAKVSDGEKKRWGALMDEYFASARDIALGVLIVDLRHKPSADDVAMAGVLRHYGIPFTVCANKSDKLKPSQIAPCTAVVAETLEVAESDVVVFSAEKGVGKQKLLNIIFSASPQNNV